MDFSEILKQTIEILNYVATNVPLDAIIASGVLSPILLGFKKVFGVNSEKVMITMVGIAGILVATGNYLLHVPTSDPTVIAMQGAVLAFMTQPFYFLLVKPASKRIGVWAAAQLAKAQVYQDDVKSAAIASPAVVPISDFRPKSQIEIQSFEN